MTAGGESGRRAGSRPWRAPRRPPERLRTPPPELTERPRIAGHVWRGLRSSTGREDLDAVVSAVFHAEQRLAEGDAEGACAYLRWARAKAPRSAALREALGVAAYAAGTYDEALAELTAYRRLSGRVDQNHLIADSLRAQGRPERVPEEVEAMLAGDEVPAGRRTEGLLVLAGARADAGDPAGALDVLGRADLQPGRAQPWHPRVWYLAGELCEQLQRRVDALEYFDAVVAVDPDFLDAAARAGTLRDEH